MLQIYESWKKKIFMNYKPKNKTGQGLSAQNVPHHLKNSSNLDSVFAPSRSNKVEGGKGLSSLSTRSGWSIPPVGAQDNSCSVSEAIPLIQKNILDKLRNYIEKCVYSNEFSIKIIERFLHTLH